MTGILRIPRRLALGAIAFLVTASAGVSFAESYRGLYLWAHHHGLAGVWAAIFPAQIDTFIAVGELALFVALADRWPARSRVAAWAVTGMGLVVSVAANVGHVTSGDLASRATAAVPPLAAAAALAVGLGVLKRVVAAHHGAEVPEATDEAIEAAPEVAPAAAPEVTAPGPGSHAAGTRPRTSQRAMAGRVRRAEDAYRASVANGSPVPERQLARDHGIGRKRAAAVRAKVHAGVAQGNGHHAEVDVAALVPAASP